MDRTGRDSQHSNLIGLGVPAWRSAVGNDAAEALAVASDEPVEGVRYPAADDSVADERAVLAHEPPAREAFGVGERLEQRSCSGIL